MRLTKLATYSLTRIVILVLYITTLQPTSSLGSLNADGVEKYVITRGGRYDTDVFRVRYKTGFQCPLDVCANTSAFENNTTPCSCACKGNTPTFLPELGSCGDTASIKKSLFGNCSEALGLESGKVDDSQLSALSYFPMFGPWEGRLNNEKAWCTSGNNQYLEIDLLEVRRVSALATQGYKGSFSYYVKTYEMEYSYDGVKWFDYEDDRGKKKTFTGNKDTDSVKYNYFEGSFETRFLRIYPKRHNGRDHRCLRVEVYGCNDNAVCSRFFEWDFFLKSLNLAIEGQVNIISGNIYQSCQVVPGSAAYYNYQLENKWVGINLEMFKVEKTQNKLFFKWADTTEKNFLGRIVQVKVTCSYSAPASRPPKTACLIFKTSGQITLDLSSMAKTTPYISPVTTATVFTEPTKSSEISLVTEPVEYTDEKYTSTNGSSNGSGVLIGVAVACAVVFAIILILLVVFCKRRKLSRRKRKKHTARLHVGNAFSNQGEEAIIPLPPSEGRRAVDEAVYAEIGSPSCEEYTLLKPAPDRCRSEYQSLIKPNEDHSGYLIPLEVTGSADCHSDGAILSELQSPKPPQDKPKDKTYDYAKPEGIIMLTASRSSLDSLDSHRQADVPSSPKNTTFQGPNSPRSPGASSKEPSHDKEGDDSLQADDYIEVLPN